MVKKNFVKYTIIFLVFIGSFLGTQFLVKKFSNSQKTIEEIIMEVNKACPKKISDKISLDSVNLLQNDFNYYYTLTLEDKDKMDVKSFEKIIKPKLIKYYKKSGESIILNDYNFNLVFHYQDAFHESISKILIQPKEYKNESTF